MRALALALCAVLFAVALTQPPDASAGRVERTLLREINEFRAEHGRDPLRSSSSLASSARAQAKRIARTGKPRHVNLRGKLRRYRRVAEAIAWHPGRARASLALKTWQKSSRHRRILLDRRLEYIGLGRTTGDIEGTRATIWVAQLGELRRRGE